MTAAAVHTERRWYLVLPEFVPRGREQVWIQPGQRYEGRAALDVLPVGGTP